MRYGAGIDLLIGRFSKNKASDEERLVYGAYLNIGHREVGKAFLWPILQRTGEIVAIPNHSTGSVNVTNGSYTVSGVGAVFTADMIGRYFQVDGGANWYRISYVDVGAQTLTLESEFVETTENSKAYEIWKRFYTLPSAVRTVLDKNPREQAQSYSNPTHPSPFTVFGADQYVSDYTTGTIAAIKDSNVLIGTGTSWLGNVRPGGILIFNEKTYRVQRVETDGRIVMQNHCVTDDFTGKYVYREEEPMTVQLKSTPDVKSIIPYSYVKRVFDMVNQEYDYTEFPEDFDLAILDFAEAHKREADGSADWISKLEKAQARLNTLEANWRPYKPAYMQFAPTIPAGMGRGR
jgi:hypothetical protein